MIYLSRLAESAGGDRTDNDDSADEAETVDPRSPTVMSSRITGGPLDEVAGRPVNFQSEYREIGGNHGAPNTMIEEVIAVDRSASHRGIYRRASRYGPRSREPANRHC